VGLYCQWVSTGNGSLLAMGLYCQWVSTVSGSLLAMGLYWQWVIEAFFEVDEVFQFSKKIAKIEIDTGTVEIKNAF
jgi:hypothetical protein